MKPKTSTYPISHTGPTIEYSPRDADGRTYTLNGTSRDAVIITWEIQDPYNRRQPLTRYIEITEENAPRYEEWNAANMATVTADLDQPNTLGRGRFLARQMSDARDTLARWTDLKSAAHIAGSRSAIVNAVGYLRAQHAARLEWWTHARQHPIYKALAPIAAAEIKHYMTDFENHDAAHFERYQPARLLWIVSENGTYLIEPQQDADGIAGRLKYFSGYIKNLDAPRQPYKFYYVENHAGRVTVEHLDTTAKIDQKARSIAAQARQAAPEAATA